MGHGAPFICKDSFGFVTFCDPSRHDFAEEKNKIEILRSNSDLRVRWRSCAARCRLLLVFTISSWSFSLVPPNRSKGCVEFVVWIFPLLWECSRRARSSSWLYLLRTPLLTNHGNLWASKEWQDFAEGYDDSMADVKEAIQSRNLSRGILSTLDLLKMIWFGRLFDEHDSPLSHANSSFWQGPFGNGWRGSKHMFDPQWTEGFLKSASSSPKVFFPFWVPSCHPSKTTTLLTC